MRIICGLLAVGSGIIAVCFWLSGDVHRAEHFTILTWVLVACSEASRK